MRKPDGEEKEGYEPEREASEGGGREYLKLFFCEAVIRNFIVSRFARGWVNKKYKQSKRSTANELQLVQNHNENDES